MFQDLKQLIIVRHGESVGNINDALPVVAEAPVNSESLSVDEDWQLTEHGNKQAMAAGRWISDALIHSQSQVDFISSTALRAVETSRYLNLFSGACWRQDPRVLEWKIGVPYLSLLAMAKNKSRDEAKQLLIYQHQTGGESFTDVRDRVKDLLRSIASSRVSSAVIVTHGGTITAFRSVLERLADDAIVDLHMNPRQSVGNCELLEYSALDPISCVELGDISWFRRVVPRVGATALVGGWNEIG